MSPSNQLAKLDFNRSVEYVQHTLSTACTKRGQTWFDLSTLIQKWRWASQCLKLDALFFGALKCAFSIKGLLWIDFGDIFRSVVLCCYDVLMKGADIYMELVQALELMLVDALLLANDYLKITSHIEGPERFWKVCIILPWISGGVTKITCSCLGECSSN